MHPILLSETTITFLMKITYIMGSSFTNLRMFFHKVSVFNTLFAPSRANLYSSRVKPFAEASGLFILAAFQLVVIRKTAFSESNLQGAK
jgi:hypothetical protein